MIKHTLRQARRGFAVACLTALALIASPQRADALGGEGFDYRFLGTCTSFIGFGSHAAEINIESGQGVRSANGLAFDGSSGSFVPEVRSVLNEAFLETCGFTNVTNFAVTGTNNYATMAFWGYQFRGTLNGVTSDYSIGIRGVSNSTVEFLATVVNQPPVVPQIADVTVASGQVGTLTVNANDPENATLSYSWGFSSFALTGVGATGISTSNNVLTFTAPVMNVGDSTRVAVVNVDVSDGVNVAVRRQITIRFTAPTNTAPTASTGYSIAGSTVTLTAVGADADAGDLAGLSYEWSQNEGSPRPTLSATNVASPTFTMPTLPWYAPDTNMVFRVTVRDARGGSNQYDVTVPVAKATRNPLTVSAGPDQTVKSGETVQLVGTYNGDSESQVSFSWLIEEDVTITNSTSASASFIAPEVDAPTAYTFQLTVTEQFENLPPRILSDQVTIFIGRAGPTEEETIAAVNDFAQTRINNLIALQPDLFSIIGGGDGAANLTVSSMGGQVDLSTAPDKNVWARLKGNWSTVDGSKGDYILGSAGTHVTLANGAVIGAMAQVDRMETKEGDATLKGTGFLVGPYVVAKLPDQPITMQGRLLYGKSSNEYSPLGTFVDRFDSTRMMAQLGVAGQIINGTTVWKPNLQAAFASEQTDAYTDGAGTDVAGTKTAVGQMAAGVDVTFALPAPTGGLNATLGLTNIWTNSIKGGSAAFEGNRARVSAGINREFAAGTSLSLTASYDGLGTNSYESIGLDLLFQHRF